MTHVFAQQPNPKIHLDALKRDRRGRACAFPCFWNQTDLWNLSCSLFIPDRIGCFSLLYVPMRLRVYLCDNFTCFFWYLRVPFVTVAWTENGAILTEICCLLSSTPFTLAKVKSPKCLIPSPKSPWSPPEDVCLTCTWSTKSALRGWPRDAITTSVC